MRNDVTMKLEIESAVTFVASLLRASSLHDPQLDSFSRSLCQLLAGKSGRHRDGVGGVSISCVSKYVRTILGRRVILIPSDALFVFSC